LETGYLNREQRRETGKFDSYDYTLNFTPSGKNTDTVKNRNGKKPTRENSTLINKDFKEKNTITNIDFKEYPENSKEFSPIEINGIEIKEKKNGKVNPFQLISELQKEETKESCAKENKERKPNPTYEAFTIFCETFERLSGANYPKDKNGNYLMSKKDAGGMVYLMRNVEQVDRTDNSIEALKVFVTAAWNLNDKWIRANFTPNTLYGQFSKIFTGYQTSSPEMIEKKKNDRIAELLAEKMKQYENQ
jgi:ribosomal protein L14E/L6E/L27E